MRTNNNNNGQNQVACRYFQAGNCMRGSSCLFRHEVIPPSQTGAAVSFAAFQFPNVSHHAATPQFYTGKGVVSVVPMQHVVAAPLPRRVQAFPAESEATVRQSKPSHAKERKAGKAVNSKKEGNNKPSKGSLKPAKKEGNNKPTKKSIPQQPPQQGTRLRSPSSLKTENILRFLSSQQGERMGMVNVHDFKDRKYSIQRGSLTLESSPSSVVRRSLPVSTSEVAMQCFASVGVFPFDPRQVQSTRTLRSIWIRYDLDLNPLPSPVEIPLPFEASATHVQLQGSHVMLFSCHQPQDSDDVSVFGGKTFFRAISIYRWSNKEAKYVHCFRWEKEGFHITSASVTPQHLIVARLPFNYEQIKEKTQKEEIAKQLEKELKRQRKEQRELQLRLERQQKEAEERARRKDPVDFFIWDGRTFVRVLEYSRPADRVQVIQNKAFLFVDGVTHEFEVVLQQHQLKKFDWGKGPLHTDHLFES